MTSLERLGLTEADIPETVNTEEELIHEVCASYRLYSKAMHHVILLKLREHFNNNELQADDNLEELIPQKGRRATYKKLQHEFDMTVESMGIITPAIIAAIAYAVVVVCFFIMMIFTRSYGIGASMHSRDTRIALGTGFVAALLPAFMILYAGERKLPGKRVGDLVESILGSNNGALLRDDRAGLKMLLREELLK